MPWKDIEKQRSAIRKHYYANKQMYVDKALLRKKEIKDWVNNIKESGPCPDCNISYPYYVMDFDHIGDTKNESINRLINNCSFEKLKEEIALCQAVCSNCHRKRTFRRISNNSV